MARFLGNHPITVDDKNRIVIPSRWRQGLGGEVAVQRSDKPCLTIIPQATWNAQYEKLLARSETDKLALRELEYLCQFTEEGQAVDKAGRMVIPADVKGYFHLEGELLLTGTVDHLELWRREDHAEYYESSRIDIAKLRNVMP